MKSRTRTWLLRAALLLPVLAAPAGVLARGDAAADPRTESNITRLTASLLAGSQLAHRPIDEALASAFLDRYLEVLDPRRTVFLATDVEEFAPHPATLARDILGSGDARLAHAIFQRYLERLRERAEFVDALLRTESFDFSADDEYAPDRSGASRPADRAAARELWRTQLRVDYLQEKLGGRDTDEIGDLLRRRARRTVENVEQMTRGQVLELYLSALAQVYDPHSDYLGHEQMSELAISMNLSLFGIGARLQSQDGRCIIVDLIPGGPAKRSGRLAPGDQIVAVAQSDEEPVDVVDMSLRRIVSLIRGPKGTEVRLTVIPAEDRDEAARRTVVIVRDEIKLEEQRASATIVDLPLGDGQVRRLGVIDVPSFYADLGAARGAGSGGGASATADVERLLRKLLAEKVEGVVLDLRRNGGGSLDEAIRLGGLFIEQGPVVQTRGFSGDVDIALDPDPSLVYGGPLVVLTSRASASASEIVAGALQDYERAVIVGDPSTFGKGTVQSIMPLAPIMQRSGLEYGFDPGALKVTIRKFYRPGGASTQLRGVVPDIVVPSSSGVRDLGEAELDNPLPWDTVSPARYERFGAVRPYLETLRERSGQRVERGEDFVHLRAELARMQARQAQRTVSLNEAVRRRENARFEEHREAYRKTVAALYERRGVSYPISVADASRPGLPPPSPRPGESEDPPARVASAGAAVEASAAESTPGHDIVLYEAQRILADYVALQERRGRSL